MAKGFIHVGLNDAYMKNTSLQFEISSRQQSDWVYQEELLAQQRSVEVNEFIEPLENIYLDTLQAAYAMVFSRHDSLRTSFYVTHQVVQQRVLPFSPDYHSLPVIDLTALDSMAQANAMARHQDIVTQSFQDLTHIPLARGLLFHVSTNQYILFFACHHILSDAYALKIFYDELMAGYAAIQQQTKSFQPLTMQLSDYLAQEAEALQGAYGEKLRQHWNTILAQYLYPVNHEILYERFAQAICSPPPTAQAVGEAKAHMHHAQWMRYTTITTDKQPIARCATALKTTSPALLLATYWATLHLCYGQEKILLISTINGRTSRASRQLIGNLACNIFLKHTFSKRRTLRDVVAPVFLDFMQACRYPIFNFDGLHIGRLRSDCEFYYNYIDFAERQSVLSFPHNHQHTPHKGYYSLSHTVWEYADGYGFRYGYDQRLYAPALIEHMSQIHLRILQAFLTNPDTPLHSLTPYTQMP